MLPQAQKDIRRALRGLKHQHHQQLLNEMAAHVGNVTEGRLCDAFVEAVERCGVKRLLGQEAPTALVSLYDFVTELTTEDIASYCRLMGLGKSGVCELSEGDGEDCNEEIDRSVLKRVLIDELYMTGFETLITGFPDTLLHSWCKALSAPPSADTHPIKFIMSSVFRLDYEALLSALPQTEEPVANVITTTAKQLPPPPQLPMSAPSPTVEPQPPEVSPLSPSSPTELFHELQPQTLSEHQEQIPHPEESLSPKPPPVSVFTPPQSPKTDKRRRIRRRRTRRTSTTK